VIRDRIFVVPGDVYSEEMLIQSYRSVMGLGFFQEPMPTPGMEQRDDGDIDIIFRWRRSRRGFNFGTTLGGWGGSRGSSASMSRTCSGRPRPAPALGVRPQYNNFSTSYTDPAIRGSQISGSASLFSTKQNRFFNFPEGERRNTGGSVRFGLPFPMDRRFSRVFLGYQLSRTSYENFGAREETSSACRRGS
jgi:outer membrane protein insertion porin family